MKLTNKNRLVLALSCVLLTGACGSSNLWKTNQKALGNVAGKIEGGDLPALAKRMNTVLGETVEDRSEYPLQRFFASFLLSQIHMAAALDGPYINEESTSRSSIGGTLGQIGKSTSQKRPSTKAHLVAAVYHASAARSGNKKALAAEGEGANRLPGSLAAIGVESADANLQLLQMTAFARLGFTSDVRKTLESNPSLLSVEECLGTAGDDGKFQGGLLDGYQVMNQARPWIAYIVFDHLRGTSRESAAYRFGIAAVEGKDRFGLALPTEVVQDVEDWILNGAKSRFTCSSAHMDYAPGYTSCLECGEPHFEYKAVSR